MSSYSKQTRTPPGGWIQRKGDPEGSLRLTSGEYSQALTTEDLRKGWVNFPELVVRKHGYKEVFFHPDPLQLDKAFWKNSQRQSNGRIDHHYEMPEKICLEIDPDYEGPKFNKNKIKLTVNSEPQGARIYQEGRYMGITPLRLDYTIDKQCYQAGVLRCKPLVAVHDARLPESQQLELKIDPDWRYEGGKTHEYATLFLLKRDPNYQPPVVVQGQAPRQGDLNVTVKKDKDALDLLQQFGQVGIIIRSLQPIR